MNRLVACVIAAALLLGTVKIGWASCDLLEENEEYKNLVAQGTGLYAAGKYEAAAAEFDKAREICFGDPGVTYNLARTKHLAGDCVAAIALYKQATSQLRNEFFRTALTAEKIEEKLAEAREECTEDVTTARIEISCADKGAMVSFGADGAAEPCPYVGRVAEGTLRFKVEMEDYAPYEASIKVAAGDSYRHAVPALTRMRMGDTVLSVNCPEGLETVMVAEPTSGFGVVVACGGHVAITPGEYQLAVPVPGALTLAANEETWVQLVSDETTADTFTSTIPEAKQSSRGTILGVSCPDGIERVVVSQANSTWGGGLNCGSKMAVAPGSYTLAVPLPGIVALAVNKENSVHLLTQDSKLRYSTDVLPETVVAPQVESTSLLPETGYGLLLAGVAAVGVGGGIIAGAELMSGVSADDASTYETWGLVAVGVGGAAVATGIALILWSDSESENQVAVTGAPTAGGGVLALRGQF